jgi:hypothetical protein
MTGTQPNDTHMQSRRDIMTQQPFTTRGLAFISAGLLALALLVVAGMGVAAPTAHADGAGRTSSSGTIATRTPAPTPAPPSGPVLGGLSCPEGEVLVMFDMPVYDANGLFIVGYVPVPFCVDEDLEPVG